MYTYNIRLHQEPKGGFTVTVQTLPGCISYCEDVNEAMVMAREDIELYMEALQERGETINSRCM